MKLSDFQKKYNHHINLGLSFCKLKGLSEIANFDFEVFLPTIGKNLQRPLVWSVNQKRSLILTFLRNQRIPSFVVIEQEKDNSTGRKYNWQVIDGKQRINTIFEFFNNQFPIYHNGEEHYYFQLPDDCKRQIDNYHLWTIDVHYSYENQPISDQTKIDLFEEINWLGTPQDIEHFNSLKIKM